MRYLVVIILSLLCNLGYALDKAGTVPGEKGMDTAIINNGSININTTNYGNVSGFGTHTGIDMLYKGANWISGKRYRRDAEGRKLYWQTYPPTPTNSVLLYEGEPGWQASMVAAMDSLSSVGYDGDSEIYELLPAYNSLLQYVPALAQMYSLYAPQDLVLTSIMGSPSPRPFSLTDESHCFSIPTGSTFTTPGFITNSAYYYDYCPLGSDIDRDYGTYSTNSRHWPLGIAIHQESYGWNLQNLDRLIVFKNTLYNSSPIDTLFDLAIGDFIDADVGPEDWGAQIATDDVSGYVKGAGYEFAYTRDADTDGGLSPYYMGSKIILLGRELNQACWYWRVGHGPDDTNIRNLIPSNRTSNEKYWLSTGRNPNSSKYTPIRQEDASIMEYEQPVPNDTRFLNSIYGAVPGTPEYMQMDGMGNYYKRLYLPPLGSLTYYTVLFTGNSLDEMKAMSMFIDNFLATELQFDVDDDLTCIPYLMPIRVDNPDALSLSWHSYTNPDHFEVLRKPLGANASEWNSTSVAGNIRNHVLTGLLPDVWYEIKLAAIYNPTSEVYLESPIQLVNMSVPSSIADETIPPPIQIRNFPNPFGQNTTIQYEAKTDDVVSLQIYNLKGQLIKTFSVHPRSEGIQSCDWDGKDENGNSCATGLYYLKFQNGKHIATRKLMLLK